MGKGQFINRRKFVFRERKNPSKQRLNLEEHIILFLKTKQLENRSNATIRTYRQTLEHFYKWYDENGYKNIDDNTVPNYLDFMRNKKQKWDDHDSLAGVVDQTGISARTTNNIIRNLRVFFNWAEENRIIYNNPMTKINLLKEESTTFEVFNDDDVRKLLQSPNIKTFTGFRDYVMMLVLVDTGIRIGELTNLRIENVDFKLRQITIPAEVAKSRTLRVVPISRKTRDELEKLVDYINVELDDYLFLSQFGERFHSDSFSKLLRNYGKKAGVVTARCSPHTFRHYFAVKYLRSGGEAFSLMRILGHTDMTMTNRYVRYASNEINEIHERASPVENIFKNNDVKQSNKRKKIF